jgi:hypothetical protein
MQKTTNVEFIIHLMEFAKTGPLMQAFVFEALSSYADDVIEAELVGWEKGFVNAQAWKACAKEVKKALDERYEKLPVETGV